MLSLFSTTELVLKIGLPYNPLLIFFWKFCSCIIRAKDLKPDYPLCSQCSKIMQLISADFQLFMAVEFVLQWLTFKTSFSKKQSGYSLKQNECFHTLTKQLKFHLKYAMKTCSAIFGPYHVYSVESFVNNGPYKNGVTLERTYYSSSFHK